MHPKLLTTLFLLLLGSGTIYAQCPGSATGVLDVNNARVRVNNSGDRTFSTQGWPVYEVPAGSGNHAAFSNALWIGGLDAAGTLHQSAATYRQGGYDYIPGPIRSSGSKNCGNRANNLASTTPAFPILALSDGRVMAFNGTTFQVFDPVTGSRQTGQLINLNRSQYSAVELPGGEVMVYGQRAFSSTPTNTQGEEFIDLATLNVTSANVLQLWHGVSTATAISPTEFLIAGRLGCEIYNTATGTSTMAASMNNPRHFHDAELLGNGNVIVGSGILTFNSTNALVGGYEVYDVANDSWSVLTGASSARDWGMDMTVDANGRAVIAGGGTNLIESYDPNAGFTTEFTLPDSIDGTRIMNVGTDAYAIISNLNTNSSSFVNKDNLILDLANGSITYGPTTEYSNTAVQLANGNIFVKVFDNKDMVELNAQTLAVEGTRWEKVWNVSRAQIDQFLSDFSNGTVDPDAYPDIISWPAEGDVAAGEDAAIAPFIDVNQDGMYDPVNDGDYPCIRGDQTLFWVFNDGNDSLREASGSEKLGVEVKVQAFAYDCPSVNCPVAEMDEATFYSYEITNKSGRKYTDVYLANWMDPDLGNWSDDYIGSDSVRGLAFTYNGNISDQDYGAFPPAFGSIVLDSPDDLGMTSFMYYNNDFTMTGNPIDPSGYYGYMQNIWLDGSPVVNNGMNGYSQTGPGPPTNYMVNGDPGFCGGPQTGWSEISAGNPPFDRRYIQGTGPFELEAGETIVVTYAFLYARDSSNANLGSVCRLQQVADSIRAWYEPSGNCFEAFVNVESGVDQSVPVTLFPNPNQGSFMIELGENDLEDGEFAIYNMQGQIVHRQPYAAGIPRIQVDTRDLASGVYVVSGSSSNGKWQHKLHIQ